MVVFFVPPRYYVESILVDLNERTFACLCIQINLHLLRI